MISFMLFKKTDSAAKQRTDFRAGSQRGHREDWEEAPEEVYIKMLLPWARVIAVRTSQSDQSTFERWRATEKSRIITRFGLY